MKYANAIAFIESIIGFEDIAEGLASAKSPHVRTHLEAILGVGFSRGISTWNESIRFSSDLDKLKTLADYLIDVGTTLNENIIKHKEKNVG
jgi:hypothetical protein